MVTYTTDPVPERSNNTAIIILALVVLAAIVIGAVYFMNYAPMNTATNTTTVDRTVDRIQPVSYTHLTLPTKRIV